MTHICVNKLTIIGSYNGLSPGRRQAIIWTNAGILLIGHLETNFSEILIEVYTFPFKEMHLNMSPAKWRPSCLGLNVLMSRQLISNYIHIKRRKVMNYPCPNINGGNRLGDWRPISQDIPSPRTKWRPIWQTTFSNVFSWMKSFVLRFRFHWSLFLWAQFTIRQRWFS